MTVDQAFKAGLQMVRDAGVDARAKDVPVIAAYQVFEKQAEPKQHDERFPVDGPKYAKILILRAYAV